MPRSWTNGHYGGGGARPGRAQPGAPEARGRTTRRGEAWGGAES
ncbi:hypothetical protein STAFG_8852 [Streptomyces afghaniensis 772]|uniref:Uncharacterized protein n=1 Tax=Streptomyces afghaniensis 772 TaxID=1283301 RepID=S4M4H5_9ACTN|nr:hypothetical protein STAFG_8852 [Streptomyces afghaniensis 772]